MVPVKKEQEKEETIKNVKSSGGKTFVSWNEIHRQMAKKGVSSSQIHRRMAEQSPHTTYMLQKHVGFGLMVVQWGAAPTLTAGEKIKIDGSILA